MRRYAVLFFLVAGCHHAMAPALKHPAPSPLAPGWTSVADAQSGVSLSLPSGWRVGVPRSFDPNSLSGSGDATNPNPLDPAIAQMAQGMQQEDEEAERKALAKMREKEGIVLHCVDGSKATIAEEPTRIYVRKIVDAGFSKLEDAASAEASDSHREMKKEKVDLPVGQVMRMTAQGRNRIGDEECHVSYVFLDGNDEYVLRFASTNSPDAILSIERQVAETFRVQPKTK